MSIAPDSATAARLTAPRRGWWLFRKRILPLALTHSGLALAPFCFSVSGLVVAVVVINLAGVGITVGLHRLLTHRSFATYRWLERALATLGALALQGAVDWVAVHRLHHAHTDADGDPHTPKDGFWQGHFLWLFRYDARLADPSVKARYVRDLSGDRYLNFLDDWALGLHALLFAALYGLGEAVGRGLGLSWAVYGAFVGVAATQQLEWLVNSASHSWGYKNFETRDRAVNCWWLTFAALGEGWHNNHHAYPRSARFGARWYELDVGFAVIRLLQALGLAWGVIPPPWEAARKGPHFPDRGPRLDPAPQRPDNHQR